MVPHVRIYTLAFVLAAASTATPTSLYFVGNSLTDGVNYGALQAFSEANGETLTWGRHMIPGAPLDWNWNHPTSCIVDTEFGCYKTALEGYTWDAISLQPFDRQLDSDVTAITNFIDLAKNKSPDVQVYLYGRWPLNDGSGGFQEKFDRSYTGGWDRTNETRDYLEKLAAAATQANLSVKPIRIIPISEVMYELDKKMRAGQVPGHSDIWSVYTDGWHMSNVGSFICGATTFATIYAKSPVGKTVSGYSLNENVASIIAQTVWDVVSTYPRAGVTAENVGTRRTPPVSLRGTGAGNQTRADALFDITGRRIQPQGGRTTGLQIHVPRAK